MTLLKFLLKLIPPFISLVGAYSYHGPAGPFVSAALVVLAVLLTVPHAIDQEHFKPFWVHIYPTAALLIDQGLATADELKVLDETKGVPLYGIDTLRAYSPLREGLRFTFLKPNLFYRNQWHSFGSGLDDWIDLEDLPAANFHGVGPFHPRLGVTWTGEGLRFKVVSLEERRRAIDSYSDEGHEVALLPTLEFEELDWWRFNRMKNRRSASRIKHGWEDTTYDGPFHAPTELEHKYFRVMWDYI